MPDEPVEAEEPTPTTPDRPRERQRFTVLDSEVLRVDDRILAVENAMRKTAEDMFLVRQVLIDQIVTVALVELALAAIIVMLVMSHRRELDGGV
jgi:hypothetical protein